MTLSEVYARWRYNLIPDHVVGEVLSKTWIDSAAPMLILIVVIVAFGSTVPDFFALSSLNDIIRQFGEVAIVTMAMAVAILAGGIDLSVGSNFALSNFVALALIQWHDWPLWLAIPLALAVSAGVGLINGFLVGYVRLRAFLTTLAILILVRAVVDKLALAYAASIGGASSSSKFWDFMGEGSVLQLPFSLVVAIVVAIILHIMLTRMRIGWHILAVGGSRRSAHNAGIGVRGTVCLTYVLAGLVTGVAGILFAARIGSASAQTGVGLEVTALTAAVLGGNSLGGGRGSIAKALTGALTMVIVTNGLIRLGVSSGNTSLILGLILLLAVTVDVRWTKNRMKILSRIYVSPTYAVLPAAPSVAAGASTPYAVNNRLGEVEVIGVGELDGPEDMVFDRQDRMYTGSRHGDIIRFFPPDYKTFEVFVHIGGFPLGLAMDAADNILVCVAGMGLYRITQDRETHRLSDETNRSWFSVIDDSRMRLADDLDIAPDGRIFFSEATIRYDMSEWIVDALEFRGNGRIICYDQKSNVTRTIVPKLVFPNGICLAHDNQSFFFAQTWNASISRYWIAGPKAGTVEPVITNLPGLPDNLNRASDGTYWAALVGLRTSTYDLALRMPGFRRRMVREVAPDEWIYPNMNTGCVIKFDESGRVLESLWDLGGKNHPAITSIREHKGYLYLGGINNDRIGRYRIPGADPNWTSQGSYWGKGK